MEPMAATSSLSCARSCTHSPRAPRSRSSGTTGARCSPTATPPGTATGARHILSYTIMNDWSAWDLQVAWFEQPMGPSKSKDSAITLGRGWSADELTDLVDDGRLALRTEMSLNGRRTGRHDGKHVLVVPGPGCLRLSGHGRTSWRRTRLGYLRRRLPRRDQTDRSRHRAGLAESGDVVRIEVEQLGQLENRLSPGPAPKHIPVARRCSTTTAIPAKSSPSSEL